MNPVIFIYYTLFFKAEDVQKLKAENKSLNERLDNCRTAYKSYVLKTDKKIASLEAANTKYRKQFGPYRINKKRAA